MAHPFQSVKEVHPGRARAHQFSKHFKRGGAVHDDEAADKKLFGKMIKAHEKEETKAEGKASGGRLDKYARGGKTKGGHHTKINIVVAPRGPHPADGAAPVAPPLPPVGGGGPLPPPMAGGLPPGLGPKPPGMMKRGGAVKKFARGGYTAGAETGKGRLQKAKKYKARG